MARRRQYGEPSVETDSQGNYLFVVLPGDHIIRQNTVDWEQTTPTQDPAILTASFHGGAEGFDYSGQWHLSIQRGVDTPAQSFYFGAEEPLGGGRYPSDVAGALGTLSADVDLTEQTGTIRLEFKHFLQIQEDDIAQVSVVADGVSEVVADNQDIGGLSVSRGRIPDRRARSLQVCRKTNQDQFHRSTDCGCPQNGQVSAPVTAGQTYYVRIDGLDGSPHPMYDLAITSAGVPTDKLDLWRRTTARATRQISAT